MIFVIATRFLDTYSGKSNVINMNLFPFNIWTLAVFCMCIMPTDLLVLCMYNAQCASPLVNYIQSLATYIAR